MASGSGRWMSRWGRGSGGCCECGKVVRGRGWRKGVEEEGEERSCICGGMNTVKRERTERKGADFHRFVLLPFTVFSVYNHTRYDS